MSQISGSEWHAGDRAFRHSDNAQQYYNVSKTSLSFLKI